MCARQMTESQLHYLIQQLHAFLEAGLLGAALGPSAKHLVYSRYVSGCIVQNAI